MAWSYRGAAYDYGSSVKTLTVSKPTGTATGDFALALVSSYAIADPTSEPSGWTLLAAGHNTTYSDFRLYYRVITADEPSSWSWGWAGSAKRRAWVWVFDGDYDTSDPVQASDSILASNGVFYTLEVPSLRTSVDGTISLIVATTFNTSSRTFAPPKTPAYTEHDDCGDTSSDWYAAIASCVYPDADTASGTLRYDGSDTISHRAGFHILLNPASGSEPEADVTVTITPADATADGDTATITGQMNPTVTLTPGDALADGTDVYVVFWADWTEHTAGGVTWTPMTATAPTWSNAVSSSAAWLRRY
jgi:hypothetical protein